MPQVDIKLTSTADTSGAEKMKGSLEGVGKSAARAASGAGTFAGKMGEASIKAAAGKDVLEGLSLAAKGGEQSFFGATKAVGAFMGILNSGPLLGIVAALGLAFAAIKLFTDRVVAATEKYRNFGEEINGTKDDYKAVEDAAKRSMDLQIEKIKEATSALKEYSDATDRAAARAKKLEEASARLASAKLSEDEQGELAKAKTPEERAAIKASYDERRASTKRDAEKTSIINERVGAELGIRKTQEELSRLTGAKYEADSDVAVKSSAYENAKSYSSEQMKTYGLGSSQHARALKAANIAKAEMDQATQSRDKTNEEANKSISTAEAKIYELRATLEATKVKEEALNTEGRVAVKAKQIATSGSGVSIADRQKQLTEARARAGESGDWAAQDAAGAELERLRLSISRGKYKVVNGVRTIDKGLSDGIPDGKASAATDLAAPLNDAAAAHESAAKQSGDSTKAASEAAEKLKESAKPLDAAPLTTALQAAAQAQQTAGAQSVAAIQSLTTAAGQLTQIAQQQSRQIETLRSQVAQVAQQVTNLRAAQNAA